MIFDLSRLRPKHIFLVQIYSYTNVASSDRQFIERSSIYFLQKIKHRHFIKVFEVLWSQCKSDYIASYWWFRSLKCWARLEFGCVSDRCHHFGDLRHPLHLGSSRAAAQEGRHELKPVVSKVYRNVEKMMKNKNTCHGLITETFLINALKG